jgi:hypothetical protein
MSGLYDEDGFDGQFERAMRRPMRARRATILPPAPTTPPPALEFAPVLVATRVTHRCAAKTVRPPKRTRACRRCGGVGALLGEFAMQPCSCVGVSRG